MAGRVGPRPRRAADDRSDASSDAAVPGADRHDITLTIFSGHPALLLLDLIATTHPDLVVLGRRSSATGAAATLGSVSQEIAGRAPVPVVVVPQS